MKALRTLNLIIIIVTSLLVAFSAYLILIAATKGDFTLLNWVYALSEKEIFDSIFN